MSRKSTDMLPEVGVLIDQQADLRSDWPANPYDTAGRLNAQHSGRAFVWSAAVVAVVVAVSFLATRPGDPSSTPLLAPPAPSAVALLPPSSWTTIGQPSTASAEEGTAGGSALIVSDTGSLERSALAEIIQEPMTDQGRGSPVQVGELTGFYFTEPSTGTSVLIAGTDVARLEIVTSAQFEQNQLEDLAADLDLTLAADEQDLGSSWTVLATYPNPDPRVTRSYRARQGDVVEVEVASSTNVPESALLFIGRAHLADATTVRGHPGFLLHDIATNTVNLAWREATNLVVEMTYQGEGPNVVAEAEALAESLVPADDSEWVEFGG